MKKICFVFNSLSIGGSQKIEAFVANACKEEYEVSVICMTKSDIGVDIDKSIKIHYVEYKRTGKISDKLFFLLKLRKEISTIHPDLICVFLADITRVVVTATTFMSIPIISSERGAPGRHGKNLKKYTKAFGKCKAVVFQTEQAKNYYYLPNAKTVVIGNPCTLRWQHDTNELKRRNNVILGAGRLCAQKRFDVLINAFGIVYKKHPDYKLYIYGDGPQFSELKELININKLNDAIYLCGYKKDVFNEIGIPEMFVLSSDYEGIPNILMEAMALGAMCISTDCEPGGARLLIDDHVNGLISPAGNYQELAKAILYAIENPAERIKMSEKATEVNNRFSPAVIKKQWLDIIADVIS